jgi:hypothetical protein
VPGVEGIVNLQAIIEISNHPEMHIVSQFDLSFFNPEEVGETSSGFPEAPRKGFSHPFGAFSTKLRHYRNAMQQIVSAYFKEA